jgi:sterol desaturase/sphingolipid hydroxylase (fatty acid hydroxylase superfamily)
MDFLSIVTWTTLALLPAFLILDLLYRARRFDVDRYWRLRALFVTVVAVGLSFVIPMWWAKLFGSWSVLKLSALGTWGGAAVGILVYQFFHYWYHRTVHRNDALWRLFHQMHHSAESLDVWGANFIAPQDAAMFISISTLVFGPLLGLSAEAAAVGALFLTFNAIFQHANIRTPQWLGYLIQRPESHGVHHQRGVHAFNYADLPLMDILFGTFNNPKTFEAELGFWNGASKRLGAMMLLRDVATPPTGPSWRETWRLFPLAKTRREDSKAA